jgi:hypothetical protein
MKYDDSSHRHATRRRPRNCACVHRMHTSVESESNVLVGVERGRGVFNSLAGVQGGVLTTLRAAIAGQN